jgi:hypothetical protein
MGAGGRREGAGRPAGRPNSATLAKRAAASAAGAALRARLGNAYEMTPLEIIVAIAREAMLAGDLDAAVSAATLAAPYVHERKGVAAPDDRGPCADTIADDTDPDVMD